MPQQGKRHWPGNVSRKGGENSLSLKSSDFGRSLASRSPRIQQIESWQATARSIHDGILPSYTKLEQSLMRPLPRPLTLLQSIILTIRDRIRWLPNVSAPKRCLKTVLCLSGSMSGACRTGANRPTCGIGLREKPSGLPDGQRDRRRVVPGVSVHADNFGRVWADFAERRGSARAPRRDGSLTPIRALFCTTTTAMRFATPPRSPK